MTVVINPHYQLAPGKETVFSVEPAALRFGPGALNEVGAEAARLGLWRVALFVDPSVRGTAAFQSVRDSLIGARIKVAIHDRIAIEPTESAIKAAAAFVLDEEVDGIVSLGGGSTIDTAKGANLLSSYPAPLGTYVAAPAGEARPVPGPLKPHIACPTTFGTASESTGIAVFDWEERDLKTAIVSRRLRPTLGILDPDALASLPPAVIAANGFDVLSHAIESYTARPFTARNKPERPVDRPLSQGANPYGDIACLEAVRLLAQTLEAAVAHPGDRTLAGRLLFAGLLAGIGFGNSGNHLPHAMSYPVSGHVRGYRAPGWPGGKPLVPHGIAVAVNGPAAFRWTARAAPERHREVVAALGLPAPPDPDEIGGRLSEWLIALMRATGLPNGLEGLGYSAADVPVLAAGALEQGRLLDNAPRSTGSDDLRALFAAALRYW